MLHLVDPNRSYSPDILALMTTVFDTVRQSIPLRTNDAKAVDEELALIILRYVDRGERDPQRLTAVARHEWIDIASSPRLRT